MPSETTGATGLAGRYAAALFELAEEGKQLDAVAKDLAGLRAMMNSSNDLRRTILSPVVSREDHAKAMTMLADKAGMGELTSNFLGFVSMNRRLFALDRMIGAYQSLLAQSRGEMTAEVISSSELSDEHLDEIAGAVKQALGSKVAIEARVDPSLLGGLIVKIGSKMFDSSLRTKLAKLQFAMKGVG